MAVVLHGHCFEIVIIMLQISKYSFMELQKHDTDEMVDIQLSFFVVVKVIQQKISFPIITSSNCLFY